MNLFHLRYFVELAHTRHYTKAAEHLCIAQPSLSHAINQLEKELGVQLFERIGRNTRLTCFGEEFLNRRRSGHRRSDRPEFWNFYSAGNGSSGAPGYKKIKIKNSTARRSIYMVSNNQIYTPPAVENFRKFILEELPGSSRIP